MPAADQEKNLKKFLSLSTNPEDTFSYDELLGFLFGLAMTPEIVLPDEWLPCIFGGEEPAFKSAKQAAEMTESILSLYNRLVDAFHGHSLDFPFDITNLADDQLFAVYEWVSGFDEALALREPLWDPESFPKLAKAKREELYFSLMIIQGLVDPEELSDFFDNMPAEFLRESFPGMDGEELDRDTQIQLFLLASLPLAVRTLQQHAGVLDKKRQQPGNTPVQLSAFKKSRQPATCQCADAGQPGSCCGGGADKAAAPPARGAKKSNVIKVDFPRHGAKAGTDTALYQLKVSLEGAKPPIWRRILVPGDFTLAQLHKIIQLCMGWTDSHLHEFLIDGTWYSSPEEGAEDFDQPENEADFTLQGLDKEIAAGFAYLYDFGDDWAHRITVEKVRGPGPGKPRPVLLAGRRACPPEDVGGIDGYSRLLDILADPAHEEYQEMKTWLGGDFAPGQFGKEEIGLINTVLEEIYP